jgi:rhomboid protease GluP
MKNINIITYLKIYFKATNFLIFVNVGLFLLTLLIGSNSFSYILLGAQVLPGTAYPLSIYILEPFRFVTSAFLHGGIAHLLLNMYALYYLGNVIEQYYGGKKVFLVYIFTAIGGAILSFLGSFIGFWQNNSVSDGLYISVGASGAIFGLVGLLLGYKFFKKKTFAPEIDIDERSLIFFVAFNLFFGFGINALSMQVYINNWAHLGGLLTGIILGAILNTKNDFSNKRIGGFEKLLFILSIIILILSFVFNFISLAKLIFTLV